MPKRLSGIVKYKLKRINREFVSKHNKQLLTHDEAIKRLNNRNDSIGKNLIIASNYKWVYTHRDVKKATDDDKVLIIPSTKYLTQTSHNEFYKIIMMDKRAEFNEIIPLLRKTYLNTFRSGKKGAIVNHEQIVKECKEEGNVLMKTQENYEAHKTELICVNSLVNNSLVNNSLVNNRIFEQIPSYKYFKTMEDYIKKKVDGNVQLISQTMKRVKMFGNVTLGDRMQGRNSIIRKSMVKKVDGLRAQILLRSELLPNQVIFPLVWQTHLGVKAKKLVNLKSNQLIGEDYWIKLKDCRICMKRDPVINLNSQSFYDQVAFAHTTCIHIGQGELENKHADFDGDTQAALIIRCPKAIKEIDAKMLAINSSRSLFQMRYSFQEHFILAMHQRRLPDNFPYKDVYEMIRKSEKEKWQNNEANILTLKKIKNIAPHIDFNKYIEPTAIILHNFLIAVSNYYGAKETYDVYCLLILEITKLVNNIPSLLDDESLPNIYFMENDILCDGIIRSCFSGSKGTLMDLYAMIKLTTSLDGTTKILPNKRGLDHEPFFKDVEKSIEKVATSARSVAKNGHNFFLANIGYEFIRFDKNKLFISNEEVHPSLDFFDVSLLMDRYTAELIYKKI